MWPQYLFVYGTLLQPGNQFAGYLSRHCTFIANGKVNGVLYDIGEYPGLIVNGGESFVYGSVYRIDKDELLKKIDAYEGYGPDEEEPNLYIRTMLSILTTNGSINAWVYIYNHPVDCLPRIPSGNYLEYLKQKKSPGQ